MPTNIIKKTSTIIVGQKYKIKATHEAKHEAQLKGLKFIFHFA